MNRNTRQKAALIRRRTVSLAQGGQDFLSAQAAVIADASERRPVTMAFTTKWEGNSALRISGL